MLNDLELATLLKTSHPRDIQSMLLQLPYRMVILLSMQRSTTAAKWTVSLPADLARFVERYQQTHALESRSEVIAQSLRTLQEAELAQAYRDHAAEWQSDPEREFWDSAGVADGLEEG